MISGAPTNPRRDRIATPRRRAPGRTVIPVRGKGQSRPGVGVVGQLAENDLAAMVLAGAGNVFGFAVDTFGIRPTDDGPQGVIFEYFLKTDNVTVHGLRLFRQPVDVPGVFLCRV